MRSKCSRVVNRALRGLGANKYSGGLLNVEQAIEGDEEAIEGGTEGKNARRRMKRGRRKRKKRGSPGRGGRDTAVRTRREEEYAAERGTDEKMKQKQKG